MLSVRREGAVAELVLGRTAERNAIDPAWVAGLAAAVREIAAAPPRALLIRADGPAFSVGGDLEYFNQRLDRLSEALGQMISSFHGSLQAIAEFPFPVVCAVQGAVAGGGLGLLWASDVIILADSARLATAFTKLGLSGDGGSSWYLPRMIGERQALSVLLTAAVLSAQDAVDRGIADAAVPADELTAVARARAAALAEGPTLAYARIRQLVRGAATRNLSEGLDAELEASIALGATEDAKEGFAAFMARRSPEFQGR